MTKFEVCQAVFNDKKRRPDDRDKAIAILRRISDDPNDPDRGEAGKLIAELPLPQADEDALIEKALAFKSPEGPYRPAIYPQHCYPQRLKKLVDLLRGEAWAIDFEMSIVALKNTPQPDYGAKCVEKLIALYGRTTSERVRASALESLRDIAEHVTDTPARNAASAFLQTV